MTQGLVICLIALPVVAAGHSDVASAPVVWLGVVIWVVGVAFESVGDAQLAAYKRDPDRGPVMDRGLWGWTRHPNYFGDACLWWGIWVAGGLASGWLPALVSVVSPIAMTYFIRNVTGAKPPREDDVAATRLGRVRRPRPPLLPPPTPAPFSIVPDLLVGSWT